MQAEREIQQHTETIGRESCSPAEKSRDFSNLSNASGKAAKPISSSELLMSFQTDKSFIFDRFVSFRR